MFPTKIPAPEKNIDDYFCPDMLAESISNDLHHLIQTGKGDSLLENIDTAIAALEEKEKLSQEIDLNNNLSVDEVIEEADTEGKGDKGNREAVVLPGLPDPSSERVDAVNNLCGPTMLNEAPPENRIFEENCETNNQSYYRSPIKTYDGNDAEGTEIGTPHGDNNDGDATETGKTHAAAAADDDDDDVTEIGISHNSCEKNDHTDKNNENDSKIESYYTKYKNDLVDNKIIKSQDTGTNECPDNLSHSNDNIVSEFHHDNLGNIHDIAIQSLENEEINKCPSGTISSLSSIFINVSDDEETNRWSINKRENKNDYSPIEVPCISTLGSLENGLLEVVEEEFSQCQVTRVTDVSDEAVSQTIPNEMFAISENTENGEVFNLNNVHHHDHEQEGFPSDDLNANTNNSISTNTCNARVTELGICNNIAGKNFIYPECKNANGVSGFAESRMSFHTDKSSEIQAAITDGHGLSEKAQCIQQDIFDENAISGMKVLANDSQPDLVKERKRFSGLKAALTKPFRNVRKHIRRVFSKRPNG